MKRKLSLILALVMIIGVFSPIANAAEKNAGEKLFDKLKEKVNSIEDIKGGLLSINSNIESNASKIYDNLLKDESINKYLKEKGITRDQLEEMVKNNPTNGIIKLVAQILVDPSVEYNNNKKQIEDLMISFYDSLPPLTQDSIDHYAKDRAGKIEVMAKVASYIIEENIGTGNYDVQNNKWTGLSLSLDDDQIAAINFQITDVKDGKNPLQVEEKDLVNTISKEVIKVLKANEIDALGSLFHDIKMINKNEVNKPSTGGGSTGGGGGSTSGGGTTPTPDKGTDSKVDIPKDKDEKATATLDKKDVKTTLSKTGTTSVKLDENKTVDTIKNLRKEAGKDRAASLEINLDNVNNLKVEVELSAKLVKELSDSKVNLTIKTKKGNIEIPADTLKDMKVPAGANLEFKMDEVENSVAQDKLPENKNAKKVLNLDLLVTKDGKSEKVENFKSPIIITLDVKSLGNPDKLAVYYLNEEEGTLEFVAGKIKDGKIVLSLNHFSKYVVVESEVTFEDVKDHWGQNAIESMAAKEILAGYDDGSFRPDDKVTRGEFSKMIVLAMELEIEEYNGEFTDVSSDDWYAGYVATMLENKIAEGYADNSFKPNAQITRAEMGVILGNVLDTKLTSEQKENILNSFNDKAEIKAWAEEGIAKAAKAEIMIGDNGAFNPNNNTSRAEVATAIYRLYNR